jgi:hypothetical protein
MEMVVIEATGEVIRRESRAARFFRIAMGNGDAGRNIPAHFELEKGRKHPTFIKGRPARRYELGSICIEDLTDEEAKISFFRWASILNEEIVLCVWGPGHPWEGHVIGQNARPLDGETIDEVKTVFEWGKELADLESSEFCCGSPEIFRMHNIVKMFVDAKIVWRGGPKWWRCL